MSIYARQPAAQHFSLCTNDFHVFQQASLACQAGTGHANNNQEKKLAGRHLFPGESSLGHPENVKIQTHPKLRREHMMEARARCAFDKTEQGPKHLILLDVLSLCTHCTRHYECAPYAARAQSTPSTAANCFHDVHDLQFVTKAIWRRRAGDSWVPAGSHVAGTVCACGHSAAFQGLLDLQRRRRDNRKIQARTPAVA